MLQNTKVEEKMCKCLFRNYLTLLCYRYIEASTRRLRINSDCVQYKLDKRPPLNGILRNGCICKKNLALGCEVEILVMKKIIFTYILSRHSYEIKHGKALIK